MAVGALSGSDWPPWRHAAKVSPEKLYEQPRPLSADAKLMARKELSHHVDELAHEVIGAALEVHRGLGPGFLEAVYERALAIEFASRRIPFENQKVIPVPYKGTWVGDTQLDFLVGGELVVEIKAVERLVEVHRAQVISYLAAGMYQLGLLLNFSSFRLKDGIRRVIWTPDDSLAKPLAAWRLGGEKSSTD